ncbi:MAG: TonB-dependent receptor [Proteobacteria bacterium]|nr:TonB-dependent receptor [Pseudomonadota bacterium]MBU1649328.1 TonB-dependent receptor [Pseudomonadota bacterium]
MSPAKHPCYPRNLAPLTAALLCCLPVAQPAQAADADPLAMYFDDSQMVEVATRAAKPLTQVAENVTIISDEEITAIHAQSLVEVLNRVAGVALAMVPPDFNGASWVHIQGSREEHVLVLIDGVRLNSAMSGAVDLSHIPLRIIKRIEIVKGPGSAVWGSSQGGVINIITKTPGTGSRPSGSVGGELGERGVGAYEADVAGKVDRVGYYLYAGQQESDGLLNNRFYDAGRAYGKLTVDLPHQGLLTFSGMAVDPHYKTGDFDYAAPYFSEDIRDRSYFITANYDTVLTESLHLNIGARDYERNFLDNRDILASSPEGDPGSLFWNANWHERSQGANGLLTWHDSWQQVALGAEINRSKMDTVTDYGSWAQSNWWAPSQDESRPGFEEVWGVFVNDTLRLGKLTLTPGIRYDQHSISGSMVSPSLGATYLLRPDTLLRATAARGFQYPILSFIAGGGVWDNPNSELKPEEVSSIQLGMENRSLSFMSVKVDTFLHHVTETWWYDSDVDWNWKNGGSSERKGFEAGLETSPWHDLSLAANGTWTLVTPEAIQEASSSSTAANLMLRYRDTVGWKGELAGHYIWWDQENIGTTGGQAADLIWNISLGRTVYSTDWLSCELYAKVYNLLDGNATSDASFYPMPGRWLLAGMRMSF